ncbi:NAD-dependent epimerase/dehydratase family protein [Micromonospora polyrhachis]|uniref:Nucleoside-diphosphate-sugar epimerase n=1 Tax=Micromonospora polyrhachis TaxID=1282883 RepID=A0A7W7STX6_9ACTN|nr:NAD(P)-dependent oxidoreductase [Micromonospora polyrhachis]MBB4960818.1 nucleoside-diphosphate-sugar epimerase [Micromonospora polyrhachis]
MRILMIGGSGLVGTMILPHLARQHEIRVLDPRPSAPGPWEYVAGDATDFAAVTEAAVDTDALVYLAMGPLAGWGEVANVAAHFDANVKGLHLALWAAAEAGVRHAVVASSMSVYPNPADDETYPDPDTPPGATDFYGLTKRLGEQVGQAAVAEHGISLVALRLCLPTPDDRWPRDDDRWSRTIATSARDTASAVDAALAYRGHGFTALTISGDAAGRMTNIDAARRLLDWEPQDPTKP